MKAGERLIDAVWPTLLMHEEYAGHLTHDLDDGQMDACPGPGHENTPRFTVGHLCVGAAMTRRALDNARGNQAEGLDVPPVFEALFRRAGPADRRMPVESPDAPSRVQLLSELRRQHRLLAQTVRELDDTVLDLPCQWKLGHVLSRHADLVMFVCSHEMLHLGQLASWRRAMGLDAAIAHMASPRGLSERPAPGRE